VYLCCQQLCKYLPQHDHLFADIAKAVPNAQFVFVSPNQTLTTDFKRRLETSFAAAGLDAADHGVVLPEQSRVDYWNLHLAADVFPDSVDWSGRNTTMEAI